MPTGRPARRYYKLTAPGVKALAELGVVLSIALAGKTPDGPRLTPMLRWCDFLLRAASPIVPHDIRRDWLREWRAEFAYTAARARPAQQANADRVAAARVWRDRPCRLAALGSMESGDDHPGHQTRASIVEAQAQLHGGRRADAGDRHRRHDGNFWCCQRGACFGHCRTQVRIELVRVYKTSLKQPDRIGGTVSPPDFTDWRRDNSSFTELAAYDSDSFALTGTGAAEQIPAGEVTGGFFARVGHAAAAGPDHHYRRRSDGFARRGRARATRSGRGDSARIPESSGNRWCSTACRGK